MAHYARAGVLLWACLIISGYAYEEVVILPDTNQTVINSGDDIDLECSYTKSVHWVLPDTSLSKVDTKYWQEGRFYKTKLKIQGVVFLDTGYYKCVHNRSNSGSNDFTSDSIYIYVKDAEHLLVETTPFDWLTVSQYRDVTLPCHVTSPEVKLTLQKDDEDVIVGMLREDGLEFEYDPTKGFTLLHMSISNGGNYDCIATLGNEKQAIKFIVEVNPHTDSVPKPYVEDATKMHIEVGDLINLTCSVEIKKGVKYILFWHYPDTRNTLDHHRTRESVVSIQEPGDMQSTKNILTIHNVTHADQGTYTCMFKDINKHENSASTNVTVYDKNTTYLNLSLLGNSYFLEQHAGDTVQWLVSIIAHPRPEIHWYDPSDEEILNSTHSTVISMPAETTLKFTSIKIDDAGNYSVVASNKADSSEQLHFTLHVYDKPMVTVLQGQEMYKYNNYFEIDCSIVGYPQPDVKWFHRECRVPHECYNLKFSEYDVSSYTHLKMHDRLSWISTLSIPAAVESGQISCWAENSEGKSTEIVNFIVTDVPYDDEIWLTISGETFNSSQQPIEKDNVTLHCGVPVANYTSEVLWYKGDKLVSNTSEYSVLNTSTKFTYRLSIYFPNITKKHIGLYRCQVTKYDREGNEFEIQLNVGGFTPSDGHGDTGEQSTLKNLENFIMYFYLLITAIIHA